MDGISISNWIAIAGLAAGVLTPFGLSWLTVWYHTKRTNEILRDHQRKDKEHDAKLHTHTSVAVEAWEAGHDHNSPSWCLRGRVLLAAHCSGV